MQEGEQLYSMAAEKRKEDLHMKYIGMPLIQNRQNRMPAKSNALSVIRVSRSFGKFSVRWSEGGGSIVRIAVFEVREVGYCFEVNSE